MHFFKHFATVTRHRRAVRIHCFKCGLFWQGLTHDLSKYSPAEFWRGAKFFQGNRSPQMKERELFGYSSAWLHHKGRNKHHYEYWVDVGDSLNVYVKMPAKYFAEMVCDRIAACKIYLKDKYTDASALNYFETRTSKDKMHPDTYENLRFFLTLLKDEGEKEMFKQLKQFVKNNKNSTA